MANETKTFASTIDTFNAKYSGGQNSPNIPVGNWEFVPNEEGTDVLIDQKTSKSEKQYDVCYVTPAGQPDGPRRTIYTSALVAPTAKGILYDNTGKLKASAVFGVFTSTKDGVRTTTVSAKADEVAKGIAQANADYSKQREQQRQAEAALAG